MKTNHPLIRTAIVASLFAFTSLALADDAMISVDARAPLRATLLPTVTVTADANAPDAEANWTVDDRTGLRVTLMPTVRVTPDVEQLAVTVLPTVKVSASISAFNKAQSPPSRPERAVASMPTKLPSLAQVTPTDEATARAVTDRRSANGLGVVQ